MKKKAMKYRLIKILCVGIIFGALIGMLLMGLSGRARIKEVREECKTTENKLKKENLPNPRLSASALFPSLFL